MDAIRSLRTRAAALLLAASAVAIGCDDATAPAFPIHIEVAPRVSLSEGSGQVSVRFTVSNSGTRAVNITTRCGDSLNPAIEQLVANQWRQYGGGACISIYDTSPVSLAAGSSRSDTVMLIEPGTFRLMLGTELGPVASGPIDVR